ncbi:MAG: transcriptional regulator NrdR [Candidatus ainarchaeum sp.]|nr:transcriptional regulator NrdR [Candidatus ainarchaeum sp.]
MHCPYCFHEDTQVIDSRETEDNAAVRRRRECEKCGKRFTTYERVELLDLMVVKKDGSRQAFDRQKLIAGIRRACEKRPIPTEKIERAVDEIERELRGMHSTEVPSKVIGDLVMKKLRGIDPVAYIRFASVYRSFKDLKAFERELDKLKDE